MPKAKRIETGDEIEVNLNGKWVPAIVRLVHPAVKEVNKPVTLTVRTTDAQTKVLQGVSIKSTRAAGSGSDGAAVTTGGSANTTPDVGPGSVTAADGSVTSGADAVAQANATQEAAQNATAEDASSSTSADSQPAADSGSSASTDASSADAAASTGDATETEAPAEDSAEPAEEAAPAPEAPAEAPAPAQEPAPADAPAADGQSLSN